MRIIAPTSDLPIQEAFVSLVGNMNACPFKYSTKKNVQNWSESFTGAAACVFLYWSSTDECFHARLSTYDYFKGCMNSTAYSVITLRKIEASSAHCRPAVAVPFTTVDVFSSSRPPSRSGRYNLMFGSVTVSAF